MAHQFHSWVTDGALSLDWIDCAAHIPRHGSNAFCDMQLMLTTRRIPKHITVRMCSLLITGNYYYQKYSDIVRAVVEILF